MLELDVKAEGGREVYRKLEVDITKQEIEQDREYGEQGEK